MILKLVQFVTLILTALALVPSAAHLFALPNKIGLAQEQYFTVQAIYRGWALFGIVLFPAVTANLLLAGMVRRERKPFWLALTAGLCLAGTLVIFFTWTYPANQATANWTRAPENWTALRAHWEYAHAVNAVIAFAALCSVTLSVLASERD